jgi:PAS domain S-box-containing protein
MRGADDLAEHLPVDGGLRRLTHMAILLGVLTVLAGWVIGYYVYESSREALVKIVYESNLGMAQALAKYADSIEGTIPHSPVLAEIQDIWTQTAHPPGSYMCVVGSDGIALLHTANPDQVGMQMGADRILPEHEGEPRNLAELLSARRDWVGLCPSADDQQLVGAFAYCSNLEALVSIYVPQSAVDARIRPTVLPVLIGIALVTLVLVPMALGYLYRASRSAHKNLMHSNLELREEIAERLQTEIALRESQDRFLAVSESAVDGIVVADRGGDIVSWNRGAEMIFGYTADEILGQPVARLMPARYREDHQQGLDRYSSTGESEVIGETIERHGLSKDGTEFPLEYSLSTWRTGGETYFCGIIRDISDRKEAEIETERLAGFPRENPNPVVACGANGALIYANPAAQQLAKKMKSDVNPALLPANHGELVSRSLAEGKSLWGIEVDLGGRVYLMDLQSGSPHRNRPYLRQGYYGNETRPGTDQKLPQREGDVVAGSLPPRQE